MYCFKIAETPADFSCRSQLSISTAKKNLPTETHARNLDDIAEYREDALQHRLQAHLQAFSFIDKKSTVDWAPLD